MALNAVDRLKVLAAIKIALTRNQRVLAAAKAELVFRFPEAQPQLDTLLLPVETEFAAADTRVSNALAAVTLTNAEKVAYADAVAAAARAGNV